MIIKVLTNYKTADIEVESILVFYGVSGSNDCKIEVVSAGFI